MAPTWMLTNFGMQHLKNKAPEHPQAQSRRRLTHPLQMPCAGVQEEHRNKSSVLPTPAGHVLCHTRWVKVCPGGKGWPDGSKGILCRLACREQRAGRGR